MLSESQLQHAIELIVQSDAIIIAAGAGMGVDSGLPDFRGNAGFWNAYPALGTRNIPFHEIASPAAFRRRAQEAWGFYGHRLALYRRTVPHVGFQILLEWAKAKPAGYSVFTSNVDGQFQLAGFDPQRLNECHGSIHQLQCMLPCGDAIWSAHQFHPLVDEIHCQLKNAAPRCPRCDGMARPNILMFDDWDWLDHYQQAQAARQTHWLDTVSRPLVIEIGAGTAIPTVRHFSQRIVRQYGGRLLRINLRESQVASQHDLGLAAGAVEALTAIEQALNGYLSTKSLNEIAQ
ncbi:SIR2 family NAD-dependent protein deacylase [Undibacterium sp. SXout20W]|uniref:SIR2 family NAD-dependent protein deacylase n=1 Tax=Undibacterium sp. SXout20W TaxID=3413051 RepID=UPI003BF183C5